MKRICVFVLSGLFASALMLGCEASGSVGDTDTSSARHTEVKKTTVTDRDGDQTTKTEVRRSNY